MWTMGDYTPGSISQLLSTDSSGAKKRKKSKRETPDGSSEDKSVHFENFSNEKDHKKYVKTPYSELEKNRNKESHESKPENRKLIFDESVEVAQPEKLKKSKKKKKEAYDVEEMQNLDNDNVTIDGGNQSKKKKKKKEAYDVEEMQNVDNDNVTIDGGNQSKKKKKKKEAYSVEEMQNADNDNVTINDGNQSKKKKKRKISDNEDDLGNLNHKKSKHEINNDSTENESVKMKKKNKKLKNKSSNNNNKNNNNNIIDETIMNNDKESNNEKFIDNEDNLEHLNRGESELIINNDCNENKPTRPKKKNKKLNNKDTEQKISPEELKRTVFVGNVPLNFTREKISRLFSQFGPVYKVRLRCIPVAKLGISKKEAACKKEFHPKRKSMAAYVVFKSEESVPGALEQNGMLADDHHLRIDVAERKEHDVNKAVFVGGLPFDVEDDEVWDVFEKCGEIESVRIVRENHTMIGKGFGYVNFTSSASVELALELDGQEIRNRKINVKRCMKIKKKKKFNKGGTLNFNKKQMDNFNKLKRSKKKKFNLDEVKVTAEQVGSGMQFQGRQAGKEKQKKKKHKLSKYEARRKKIQKILTSGNKNKKSDN